MKKKPSKKAPSTFLPADWWSRVLAASSDHIYIFDSKGRYAAMSEGAARVLGFRNAAELIGKTWRDVGLPPKIMDRVDQQREAVMASGRPMTSETHFVDPSGDWHFYEYQLSPLRGPKGVEGVLAVSREVTDRRRAERRLDVQYAVAREVTQSRSADEALSRVLHAIGETLEWDWGGLWDMDQETGELRNLGSWSFRLETGREMTRASKSLRFAGGQGLPGRAWKTGKPTWCSDILKEDICLRKDAARKDGLHSAVVFPIRVGEQVLAVMEFFSREIRRAEPETLEVLAAAGSQMGQFLERRRIEQSLRENEERLRRQNQVLADLAMTQAAEDLPTALRRLTEKAAETLDVERASLWLYDGAGTKIRCVDLYERSARRHSGGLELAAKDYPAYFAALEKARTIAAHDARTDPRTREFSGSYLTPLGIGAMLDSPIRTAGKLAGVICHEHVGPNRRWLPEEENFSGSLADAAALALEVGERRKAEEEIRALNAALERRITERTTQLRATEESFRLLVAGVRDYAIFILDPQGRVASWNAGAERIKGYAARDIIGQHFSRFFPEEDIRAGKPERELIIATREGRYEEEGWRLRKDGSRFWAQVTITAMRDDSGSLRGFAKVTRDITDRRKTEMELAEARDAALESARIKSEFVANMSHEIRTPMNAIVGMTGLLMETPLTPQQRHFAEIVRRSGEALLEMINNILDHSRIEAGKMPLARMDFSPEDVAEGTLELFAGRAQEKGLDLDCFVNEDVPASLRGDSNRLRQILLNLVGNAVKFTEKGGVTVRLSREKETADQTVIRCEVSDTGIGISEEGRRGLFQAFTQADASASRAYGGTGLGLTISKQLAELMGGEIGFESEPGRGSLFWCRIPFQKSPASHRPPRRALAGRRVLVLESGAGARRGLANHAASWGMLADEVSGAEEALEALQREAKRNPYSLFIMGGDLDGLDAFALARRLRAIPGLSGVRLALIAPLARPVDPEAAREAGIDATFTKPVRARAMYEGLAPLFTRKEAAVPPAPPPAPSLRRKDFTVLLAEDNAVNREVAIHQLQKLDVRVDDVANGREALEALDRFVYDLVLMDCQMPLLDGYAAARELRQREGKKWHTPVVAMTAHALEGDREKCLAAGMDDHIAKPVQMADLAAAVMRWDVAVDPAALAKLRELGTGVLEEIADLFLKETPAYVQAIRRAAAARDAQGLAQTAHTLKGSAGNLGARGLQTLAFRLEKMARSGMLDHSIRVADALDAEFHAVARILKPDGASGS